MKMPQPPALTVPENNPMQRNASFLPKPTLCGSIPVMPKAFSRTRGQPVVTTRVLPSPALCLRSHICSLPLGKDDTREGGRGLTEVA